ncbi:MAG: hemolysin family protein [Thermonemataceae bacterium]|nr:hemolysin family protein [Thermonemataceae bacterium]
MVSDILLTLLLVALNGLFVAAEFAIVKVRASQVETKYLSGNRFAKNALHIINHLDAYLSATQLGITLASLGLGWVGEPIVAKAVSSLFDLLHIALSEKALHQVSLVVAFSLITVLHIVFGELAPKSLAIRYPEKTTMLLAMPLQGFYLIFRPFIWVLNGFANFALRLIGVPVVHEHDTHTEDEIRLLLEESKKSGNINTAEHELLENVFKFDDRFTEQIMTPRTKVVGIRSDATMQEAFEIITQEDYSRLPVYENSLDNIIGILHTKDIIKNFSNNADKVVTSVMRKPYMVSERKSINTLLREMQKERIQMAIVLDDYGGTAGIVTMEDILEEIVGDIQDEYDNETPIVQQKSETEFVVKALANIDEVNKSLPEPLPESEDYDTVAGFINEVFGSIPDENEELQHENYIFRILHKEHNAVDTVLLKLSYPQREEKPAITFE